MKTKIKEVQDYFIGKMLNNDMEVTDIKEHTLCVLIDEEFQFTIWTANGKNYIKPYEGFNGNFMELKFTQKQCHKLYSVLKSRIKEFNEKVLKRQKTREFNRLKKELNL